MDTNTLLIILVVLLVLGGGGFTDEGVGTESYPAAKAFSFGPPRSALAIECRPSSIAPRADWPRVKADTARSHPPDEPRPA